LPTLPPLPPLPKRDPLAQRELPPPTFTPPAPPPPAQDRPEPTLRGTLPAQGRIALDAAGEYGRSGATPVNPPPPAADYAAGPRAVVPPEPSLQGAPGRPQSRQYDVEFADYGGAPDLPVVDAANYAHQTSGHVADQYPDDRVSAWPDDAQYSPSPDEAEQYDYYDESYAVEGEYKTDEGRTTSPLGALRRKLRPWHAIAAVAALAVVSIGWSFLHRAGIGGSREIATIEAPDGPMKVKPAIEPESDAPTAGAAAVLDRNEPEPVKKVVKNLEQAVDPSVAPQQNRSAGEDAAPPAEIPGAVQIGAGRVNAPHEPPPTGGPQQPRKVKSIAVPAAPAVPPAATATAVAPQAVAPTTAKPATGATYSAQFAATNSEAEARALIKSLSGKYSGSLGGGKPTFKPVKTGDKTVYRVRVGGLSREAADALCLKAKAGGDSCAVVGN